MTRAQIQRIVREKRQLQRRAERQAVSVAASAIKKQVSEAVAYLNKTKSIPTTMSAVGFIISPEPIRVMMRQIYLPWGKEAAKQQRSFLLGQKQTLDQEVEHLLLQYIDWNLGTRIQDITDTTKKEILKWLAYAESEGMNWNDAGKLISNKVGLSKSRSRLIARTESVNATNYGSLLAVKQTGLKTVKAWVHFLDDRTRFDHAEMNSETFIPTEQPFTVGGMAMMHPGDPAGGAKQCCNCRCTAIYEVVRTSQQRRPDEPDELDAEIAAIFDSIFVPA